MEDRYILFKGKFDDSGRWVKGQLVEVNDTYLIIPNHAIKMLAGWFSTSNIIEVKKDTICQCTGLKDKNGNLIWENDIVRDEHGNFYKAFWQNNYYQFSWICVKSDVFLIGAKWDLWSFRSFEIEVIGNIFDNPELVESEEKQ